MNTFEQHRVITQYRAAFHDMPVGTPMDGAAYGEYLKSKGIGMIIGVVASVVTMGAAVPLLAGGLATQIAGGVMMAGGVMSGVGAVTGNKKLMKIGGIMSLAGGVGGIASNALNAAGVGGAFASESGSTAIQNMAGSFMESVNSVGGSLGIGDIYNADAAHAAATAGESTVGSGAEAGAIDLTGTAETPLPIDQSTRAAELANADIGGALNGDVGGMGEASNNTIELSKISKPPVQTEAGQFSSGGSAAGKAPSAGEFGVNQDGTPFKPTVKPPTPSDTFFGMNKTELMKTGAGLLEKGAAAAFTPDQQAMMDALTDRYKAETTKLSTENEIQQYKLANAKKQVVMISANDPQMEQKVAVAAAAGYPVAFIPAIAAAGVTPKAGGAQMAMPQAQKVTAQTPVRQGIYS